MSQRQPVDPAEVRHALRSLRPMLYDVQSTADGVTLALVMNASAAARRNAATKILGLLAEHGLRVEADLDTLAARHEGFPVTR